MKTERLSKNAEGPPQMPRDFCGHIDAECPFCRGTVSIGHVPDGREFETLPASEIVFVHQDPACEPFMQCESSIEFSLIARLKARELMSGEANTAKLAN